MVNLQLDITIPDGKVQYFKDRFFVVFPKPVGFPGTDKEWAERAIKDLLKDKILEGHNVLHEQTKVPPDPDPFG